MNYNTLNELKIVVLCGGLSTERNISFLTGSRVCGALRAKGHRAVLADLYMGFDDEKDEAKGFDPQALFENLPEIPQYSFDGQAPDLKAVRKSRKWKSPSLFGKHVLELCAAADIVFIALHGKNGEDGTIQGLFELARIPYVGCGVLASAVSMDKLYTKIICNEPLKKVGVRQAEYVSVVGNEIKDMDECVRRVEKAFEYPVFVKPSSAGSSCGVTKAYNREQLIDGIKKAYEVDYKVLIEETIVGREVECAVFRDIDGNIKASGVGEIKAAADFYDYDAKYNNPKSETDTDPDINEDDRELIRRAAKVVFDAVDGFSLARIDFFLTENGPVFNELNTLPGFTAISMYPMLWGVKGIDKPRLVQALIDTAFTRPTTQG